MTEIKLYDTWNNKFFKIEQGNQKGPIRIYICGPTVYTHTHIGHLKTYMTFDIIRRVMTDYFKLPVRYMMNITNVDDKIIKGCYQKEYNNESIDLDTLEPEQYLLNQKFIDYADYWEQNFFEMMDKVGIRRPNIVSRVTEYIDEIIEFVDAIDKKGFAFEHDGSVYFYGTLYENILDDSTQEHSKDPKNIYNFVLLKKARSYEPGWETKWGKSRPGWHIECSAMASSVFGSNFEIHGGGIDLKFPHHNNEMLQSNSRYYERKQSEDNAEQYQEQCSGHNHSWVDHFMHTGHLNIEGFKMSRSLKNFVTVAKTLEDYSPDQLRMLFLLHAWADTMDYSSATMSYAMFYVEYFQNFFVQASNILLRSTTKVNKKFGKMEIEQAGLLASAQIDVDRALRNNIDTPEVMRILHEYTKSVFVYTTTVEGNMVSEQIITDSVTFVKSILNMFGLTLEATNKENTSDKEDKLVKVIADLRMEIRDVAKDISTKIKPLDKQLAKDLSQQLYQLTDRVRDQILPSIGTVLTDR